MFGFNGYVRFLEFHDARTCAFGLLLSVVSKGTYGITRLEIYR